MIFEIFQLIILTGMVASAAISLKSRDLLASTILLSVMSLLLSVEFYILQAPDVAIAEAVIGTGFSTAIYVIAIRKTGRWENEKSN